MKVKGGLKEQSHGSSSLGEDSYRYLMNNPSELKEAKKKSEEKHELK
jgi:hypothetical protein